MLTCFCVLICQSLSNQAVVKTDPSAAQFDSGPRFQATSIAPLNLAADTEELIKFIDTVGGGADATKPEQQMQM